jgi:hypothetical protein
MVLFHMRDLIQDKARAAGVSEFGIDLDIHCRQSLGVKNILFNCA